MGDSFCKTSVGESGRNIVLNLKLIFVHFSTKQCVLQWTNTLEQTYEALLAETT